MTIRKFYTFRVNDSTPDDHTGRLGEITYRDGFLYYHDGVTAGGEVIGGGGSGSGGPTSWSSITGKPSFAAVATSGAYADLTGKPTIPSKVSDLTNDSGFITSVAWADVSDKPALFSGAYADLTGKPTIPSLDGYATESWVNSQNFGSGSGAGTGDFTFTNNTITTDNGQDDIVLSIQGYDATQPTPNLVDFSWTFDTRGGLTLPSNLFFAHAYFTAEDDEQIFAGNTNKDFRLRTMNNSVPGINDWIFDIDGTLTVPGTITKGDNLTLNSSGIESGNVAAVIADGDAGRVFLRTDDGTTLRTWQFDKDGNLTLPNGGDIKDSSGNSVLGSGSSDRLVNGNKSLILASDGNVDVNGHIAIKKESEYLSTIGKTTTIGSTILNTKLFVNYNEVGITSTVDVENMPDETATATVKVGAAVATMLSTDDDAGNPVTQYRGQLDVSYTGITLTLATPTTETNWVFDNNNLKLPAGGDIVDSNGNSVLGGGGVSLPANASGYLTNDGEGNLSWAAGDGTFSGDYNDLVNKPSIPAAQINSDWNETISESPAYIFNKPTIPTSLSDFGITAGLDGQVLTLNSSLVPVWATPSSGSGATNEITNTDPEGPTYSVSVGTDGVVTMVTSRGNLEFGALPEPGGPTHFHIMRPTGQEGSSDLYFGDDYNYVKLPSSSYSQQGVEIGSSINQGSVSVWRFGTDGHLTLPAGGDIKDSNGTSVLGGGSGASGFTKAVVAGQNDILAEESGNELTLVAGDGIAITTNESDGTITIAAASNTTPQYGYFSELVETSSSNRVNTQAVVMDSDGNSYISYVYWDDNQSKDISGVAKYSSTGEQLWATNLASQNPNARELNIRSLEFATVDGDPSLIAVGYYYDNNTNKDVAFMFYVNPASGSVGEPLVDCELVALSGMNVKDGVAGYDGSNPFAVVVGETYDQTLVKTLTPLAGSTTDKLFVSWADFAASGVNTGESVYYVDGPNQYGVTMNAIGVSATVAGSSDPAWAGLSITVSKTEAGNYTITGVNGWGYLVNGWSNPVTLTVLGSALGGADGTNDLTFDFSNVVFNNNSSNIQAAISNIMGTPPAGVYCPGWGGFDWNTQVGNALNFNYQLNAQAYVARFGQTASWTKNFGGGSYDRLNSVVVDNSGNVYAVGYVWNGSRGGLVIKYDIDGNQQWAVYINPENNTGNALMSVDLLSDGNVITVDEDGVITKLNSSNGDIMWQVKADNGPSWDSDFRGTATPDGDYIITNDEDDNYTQYVMRVSGSDGSSVWDKRITRTYGGDNGEVTTNDDGQYIDCNATHLAIAGRTEPPSGNSVGLIYSFPITGDNVDGTYGQYVITSESMNWTTLSTTSIAATVTNTDISVTVNPVSPTSSSTYVTTSTVTTMGGEPVVEPTVIEWTNPNDNVWRIEDYNGGASVYYDGGDYDAKWFDIDNHTSGGSNFRGAIIQYHAFIQNQGTMIGTIHLATDYSQEGATHTEHISGNSDLQFVTLWDCNNNDGELYFKMTNGNSANLFIQWTAKVFYGQEYND